MADPKQLEILKQGVDAWNRYVGPDLEINLSRAVLLAANLRRANLQFADLLKAKLLGANLREANLLDADLQVADLRGTGLSNASLWRVDCRTVINDVGEREFTDLSETVGLRQEQLESINGDRGVILPDHLIYPDAWPEPPGSGAVPEQPEAPFVFISYAHDNKKEVAEIVGYLQAYNINIWWDDYIAVGDKWRDRIKGNLEKCQAVLTLWTEQSVQSDSVIEEAGQGKGQGKLLHAKLDGAQLPYGFGEVQYADLTNWNRQSDTPERLRFIKALRQKLDPDDANVKRQADPRG